ncbi:MFS transporter [Staphylococcus haemolyticus]|uniref:MFS transporter n=1 Tax=Staphylococcus haemolyticus TaxID=1283 RepID=UPI0034D506B3
MPFVIYVLGLLIFAQTTSEFMVAGIMPVLSEEFGVSISSIGYLISAYSAGMVIGGPILTLALLKVAQKKALLTLTFVYLIGQILGAMAPNYEIMFVARLITGISSAACFGLCMAIAFQLVSAHTRGRAASIVLGGLMLATAAGLPITIMVEQYFGWRASFWTIALLVLLAGILAYIFIPSVAQQEQTSVRKELGLFKNYSLWAAYVTSMVVIGAIITGFSYFTPILTSISGVKSTTVPYILAGYGIAMVIGNVIVGRLADTYMISVLVVGLSVLTVTFVVFGLFTELPMIAVISIITVGFVGLSMNPALAIRVTRVGGTGTLVASVHNSMINLGNTFGPAIGGFAIEAGFGLASPLWVGLILSIIALISLLPIVRGNIPFLNTK